MPNIAFGRLWLGLGIADNREAYLGFQGSFSLKRDRDRERLEIAEIGEIDVWCAANQLAQKFPEGPLMEALSAPTRVTTGDMFNLPLWTDHESGG